jgi:anaphase-promoting complex subunit 8
MWNALGACFESVGQSIQAIKCYKRALISSDTIEPHTLAKIAKLYHHSANKKSLEIAAYFYQKYLDEVNQDERVYVDNIDFRRLCG